MEPAGSEKDYDVVVIGAGMSGLAAAIRLGMYGQRVLLLEKHDAPGGLNSFYRKEGISYDVGLHALTNFVPEGVKGAPLNKVFRQLRIRREDFDLSPQVRSSVRFPGRTLRFGNGFELFRSEVMREFPGEAQRFDAFVDFVRGYEAVNLAPDTSSARAEVESRIGDPELREMLYCPLMYYGSARERDMDFGQFVVLFQAVFLEGFARPFEGVRRILRVLLKRAREAGVERRMRCGVKRLITGNGKVCAVELDNGEVIRARWVVSSAGRVETRRLCAGENPDAGMDEVGRLSFAESIVALDRAPVDFGLEETIVFFNRDKHFDYSRPVDLMDYRSGVLCVPNNYVYEGGRKLEHGFVRVTCKANHDLWTGLPPEAYLRAKDEAAPKMLESAAAMLPEWDPGAMMPHVVGRDVFTPCTITRYTGHFGGAVYGAPVKSRDGRTPWSNLILCGTDQGFLGIVGAMLSGISIVNYHILKGS